MKLKEVIYYSTVGIFVLTVVYLLIFKTEILTNRVLAGMVLGITYLILRQLYTLVRENGKNKSN